MISYKTVHSDSKVCYNSYVIDVDKLKRLRDLCKDNRPSQAVSIMESDGEFAGLDHDQLIEVFLWAERVKKNPNFPEEIETGGPVGRRADKITNSIENLTNPEKERLAFLILWSFDGPEQGFINAHDTFKCKLELAEFLSNNGIHAGGQWLAYAKSELENGA